ncbi:hypothetical protein P7K49_005092 [Saguinus oedipus]|uniref:Uncharacterized protein n=1 Tax=Saguinus oedipus TaxID=9490 RepID=A0ABQ9W996_SAGOE|nr:hypothetical protein P7K49_005092 [Saguinus oedipus]
MPTYLVAFVICDYDHVNRTERGKEVDGGMTHSKGCFMIPELYMLLSKIDITHFQGKSLFIT